MDQRTVRRWEGMSRWMRGLNHRVMREDHGPGRHEMIGCDES